MGSCCKLPDGALLDVHVYDASACPSSFVATGIRMERARGAELSYLLRCTKIDESRFALGEPQPASYVGWTRNFIQHYALAFLGRDEKRVIRSSLPLGIRYAVGRRGEFTWDLATCVGDPPGALLTEKLDKHCADLRFRRLLAIDAAAPPPEIYPSCNIISSITDPEGRCLDSTNAN